MDPKQNRDGDDDVTNKQETDKKDEKQTCEDTAISTTKGQNAANEDVKTFDDTTKSFDVKDVNEDPNRDINALSSNTENSINELCQTADKNTCQKDTEEITPNTETNKDEVDETTSSSVNADGEGPNDLEDTMTTATIATDVNVKRQNEPPSAVAEENEVKQQNKEFQDKTEVGQEKKESEDMTEQLKQECKDLTEVLKQSEVKEDEASQQKEEDQHSTEVGQQKVKGGDARETGKQKDESNEKSQQQKQEDRDATEPSILKVDRENEEGQKMTDTGQDKEESKDKGGRQKKEGEDTTEAGKQKEKKKDEDRQQKEESKDMTQTVQQMEESKDEAGQQKERGQAATEAGKENEYGQPKEEGNDAIGVGQGKEDDQDMTEARKQKEENRDKTEQQKQQGQDTTGTKKQEDKSEDDDGQQREVGPDKTKVGQQGEESQNAVEAEEQNEEREDGTGQRNDEGNDIKEDIMKGKNQQTAVETSCSETQTEPEIPVGASGSTEATEENAERNMSKDERPTDHPETTDKQGLKSYQQDEHEKSFKQEEKEQESEKSKSPENIVDKDKRKDTCDKNKTALESEYVSPQDGVSAQSKDLPSETDQAVIEDSKISQKEAKLTDTVPEKAQSGERSEDESKLKGNHQADFDDPNKITQSKTPPNENIPGENLDKAKETELQPTSLLPEEVEKGPPIAYLIEYCEKCEPKFVIESELETIKIEYAVLQEKAKTCGYEVSTIWPPSERNAILNNDNLQNASSPLQNFILRMHEQSAKRGDEAVTEYIQVSTYALKEHTPKAMPNRQTSLIEKKKKEKKQKKYPNCLEKLLDIEEEEWHFDKLPRHSVSNDYTHLLTAESVLKYNFPEDNVLNFVKIDITNPDQVPPEYHHRALYQFLIDVNSTEYGVDKIEMWTEYGRLVVAERQLALARRAVGPDLDKNVIVDKKNYHKMQNELKAKIDEVEELSTRLSRFASQQLTEGNPNIADLSDTHRPTRLGEMYSQLFDDEWSEAFEAFKPKYEDDDDIFPDTLFILQNLLMKVFEFCQVQSKKQMFDLEKTLGRIIGIGETSYIDSSKPVESETLPTGDNDKDQSSETDISKSQGEKSGHCHKDSNESNDDTKSETQPENVPKKEHQEVEQKEKDVNADNSPQTTENQNEHSDELKQNTLDKNECTGEQTEEKLSKVDEDLNEGSEEDVGNEENEWESREKDQTELMIERHARDFRKAAATPSAISKAKAFIEFELPKLVDDKEVREDERTVTYINKCVELCWYMCMQDPPMTIVSPSKGETIDKAEFSHHGRRGKFVETCVWPALLLHEKGPLVCKGYVLPQNKKK